MTPLDLAAGAPPSTRHGWSDARLESALDHSGRVEDEVRSGAAGAAGAAGAVDEVTTPLDRWLADQRRMSAVERFADLHDRGEVPETGRWRELLPAAPPGPGEQYAFDVDLDACTGCKSCVAACHSLNGLDAGETWRSVGLLVSTDVERPVQQHVTTACHHCLDPACLTGCPVDAYDKDPLTGIVQHLDDQCIGCRYCTLMCPYEVPRYHRELGIVRKCDLCADRLAVGEAPACAQACPTDAIAVTTVRRDEVRSATAPSTVRLVPTAPRSALTAPTTTYRSTRGHREVRAADDGQVEPAHGHPPLVAMLVLTQLAVGVAAAGALLRLQASAFEDPAMATASSVVVALAGTLALGASVLHLGRPHLAWRAVRGVGHSWLSREIVAFGAFGGLALVTAAARVERVAAGGLGGDLVVAAAGVVGVGTSAAVYAATGRRWWSCGRTAMRFGLAAVALGASATALLVVVGVDARQVGAAAGRDAFGPLLATALVALAVATALDLVAARPRVARPRSALSLAGPTSDPPAAAERVELARSARLLSGPLRPLLHARGGLALVAVGLGLMALAITAADGLHAPGLVVVVVLDVAALGASEVIGRHIWFLAVAGDRMPGAPR